MRIRDIIIAISITLLMIIGGKLFFDSYSHKNNLDDGKSVSEQNRCAMACQGCGAVFYFI